MIVRKGKHHASNRTAPRCLFFRMDVVRIIKKYTIPTNGRRFAAVEVNGTRLDIVVRIDRTDREETRASVIKQLALEQYKRARHKEDNQ